MKISGTKLGEAAVILRALRANGMQVWVDGENLMVRPSRNLTETLRKAVTRAKPELMWLLSREPSGLHTAVSGSGTDKEIEDMRHDVQVITPQMAEEWLAKNADFQRPLRQSVVDRYARDMLNNTWALTHQGIAFDSKGRLIDGQHRLAAIRKANVPVRMVVARDTPAPAFDHVDLGFGRTNTDVFKARGDAWITNDIIAIARFMHGAPNAREIMTARSPFELRELVEKHKTAIAFVQQNCERHVPGVTIAPVVAAVAVAYYSVQDRLALAAFIRLLCTGVSEGAAGESVVVYFRDQLKDSSGNSKHPYRIEMYLKTQRVLKAYLANERLSKLYTPTEPCYVLKSGAAETL